MFARSSLRLWTPQYFRGPNAAARRVGARPTRETVAKSVTSAAAPKPLSLKHKTSPRSRAHRYGSSTTEVSGINRSAQLSAPSTTTTTGNSGSSGVDVDPTVQQAQQLLSQLNRHSSSSSALTKEATQNFVSFTARRDIFGPLRRRLPASPMHRTPTPLKETSGRTNSSSSTSATPLLRVIPVPATAHAAPPPPAEADDAPARPFTLAELTVFLQLYDAVEGDEGHVLAQLLAEVQRRLSDLATARNGGPQKDEQPQRTSDHPNVSNTAEKAAAPLPLPALLFTMSSLGVVEEAALDLITSAVPVDGTSRARRGLLYRQLPMYSADELVMLLIALHRFGHAMQPSMKAVVKALRAAQYNTGVASGRFHRVMRAVKKGLRRKQSSARGIVEGLAGGVPASAPESLPVTAGDDGSMVRLIQQDAELQSTVLALRCPLFLLLEALTALSLTVHRRNDVVSFLSDWIAVTGVMELATVMRGDGAASSSSSSEPSAASQRDADRAYVLLVAHQLLRAAKLTEEMDQPQPLLSEVFAWSCTLSSSGVVVDGGEAGEVPSDRVAFYDHVTADLVKLSRTD